ncbi:hypothetical protein CCY16_00370 [Wolbachia endosymbiont of Wuchereria bancrofti]|nr:hypothetical protein CCY16_00370 [Wolbachia endosymbiont of Wuchereria bancrofti]
MNQKLESRKSYSAKKVRQDFERIVKLDHQCKGKGIFRSGKVAGPKSTENSKTLRRSPQ